MKECGLRFPGASALPARVAPRWRVRQLGTCPTSLSVPAVCGAKSALNFLYAPPQVPGRGLLVGGVVDVDFANSDIVGVVERMKAVEIASFWVSLLFLSSFIDCVYQACYKHAIG